MDRWKKRIWKCLPSQWVLYRKRRMQHYMAVSDEELRQHLKRQIQQEIKIGCVILMLLFLCIVGACISGRTGEQTTEITRNPAGGGEAEENVTIDIEGEQFEYSLTVEEEYLTKAERESLFQESFQYLEKEMLCKNPGLNEVRSHLRFLWEIPDKPVEIRWETEDDTLIDTEGNVYNQSMKSGSKVVHIKLMLSYQNDEEEKVYKITIFPRQISGNQKAAENVLAKIRELEKENRTSSILKIPSMIEGAQIKIGDTENPWVFLAGMIAVFGALLIARQWEYENRRKKEVRRASEMEYTNILWQFVLFLEAGFTIPMAWLKIVSDYEKNKKEMPEEKRYVYEQMSYAWRQMELGYSMEEVFLFFSRKMGLRSYAKLMTLFLQNITKGSKHMLDILKTEEHQAFVDRCEQAKRMGEEADTKLLLPMGMMLLNILLLLMVPAYLQL